jgi:hypothetical protein
MFVLCVLYSENKKSEARKIKIKKQIRIKYKRENNNNKNPSHGMDVCVVCCVSIGLCKELITRSRESYKLCVCLNCV